MATEISGAGDSSARPRNEGQGQRGGRGRGRGQGRGRGGGNSENGGARRGGRGGNRNSHPAQEGGAMNTGDLAARFATSVKVDGVPSMAGKTVAEGADENEAEVCFICASPVVHEALMPCNHRTCHICCLRMRALYKDKNCMHCRVSGYPVLEDVS